MAGGFKNSLRKLVINGYPLRNILIKYRRDSEHLSLENHFIKHGGGEKYGLNEEKRKGLVNQFKNTLAHVESATSLYVHLLLAEKLLAIDKEIKGDVIECGCFKGASTINLSIICKLVNRKLIVCDSFEGLPSDDMQLHTVIHTGHYGYYKEGMFRGTFDEVKGNIEKFGEIGSCEFIKGYFNESLHQLKNPIVFGFIDVDLVSSTKDALLYIWPLLINEGELFSDDAGDLDVVKVFYDESWWKEKFGCAAPGFIGSGSGLSPCHPASGYIRKMTEVNLSQFKKVDHLYYPDKSK